METPRITAAEVRQQFLDFFATQCNHTIWPSSPVVPYNDPTLLFINAGMNQFKPVFLGDVPKNSPFANLKRAVDSQKCIRAGGKHNDLEDVGNDVYHHTFFEMLGNWSFGDYFKKEAIKWSWTLLTEVWKIPAERLYASYYGGDPKFPDVPADLEARDIWLQYLPASRVLPYGAKENFWEMGDTGPCGPCSEIHYDRIGGGRDAASLVNGDDPDVLEIWNLVFMQFNREKDGSLTPLPSPCVDTGMGLERVTSVLQNKRSNYDTDLFTPIFGAINALLGGDVYQGRVGADDVNKRDTAYRVIADHIRCLTVAMSDGALPSNEGRGYVVRRILRRAVRFGQQFLDAPRDRPWLSELLDSVLVILGDVYPELRRNPEEIRKVIREEELQFGKTLMKGTEVFMKALRKCESRVLSGEVAFRLLATYGFPLDLTELMAREHNLSVDVDGFNEAFEKHQKASENANFKTSAALALTPDAITDLEKIHGVKPTEDELKYVWETYGHGESIEATLMAIWDGKRFVDRIPTDGQTVVGLIFDKTPFYAESGGQIGDQGDANINVHDDAGGVELEFEVEDTKKYGGYVLHIGKLRQGSQIEIAADSIRVKESKFELSVNYTRRALTAKNHTGTHVLNHALRKVLGPCDQRGSLVEPQRLRFDFAFSRAVTDDEIARTEKIMAEEIAANRPVDVADVPLHAAMEIVGLRAVFGEIYPDPVRVVSVGEKVADLLAKKVTAENAAVEFCGGTHLTNSNEIEAAVVISEESVARGVRRMEVVTGPAAKEAISLGNEFIVRAKELSVMDEAGSLALRNELLKRKSDVGLLARKEVERILDEGGKLRLEAGKAKLKQLRNDAEIRGTEEGRKAAEKGAKFLVVAAPEMQGNLKVAEAFVAAAQSAAKETAIIIITPSSDGNIAIFANVPKYMQDVLPANEWVSAAAKPLGGKGGGKPNTARGTAKSSEWEKAVELAEQFACNKF